VVFVPPQQSLSLSRTVSLLGWICAVHQPLPFNQETFLSSFLCDKLPKPLPPGFLFPSPNHTEPLFWCYTTMTFVNPRRLSTLLSRLLTPRALFFYKVNLRSVVSPPPSPPFLRPFPPPSKNQELPMELQDLNPGWTFSC